MGSITELTICNMATRLKVCVSNTNNPVQQRNMDPIRTNSRMHFSVQKPQQFIINMSLIAQDRSRPNRLRSPITRYLLCLMGMVMPRERDVAPGEVEVEVHRGDELGEEAGLRLRAQIMVEKLSSRIDISQLKVINQNMKSGLVCR